MNADNPAPLAAHRAPQDYPRRILLVVTGLTPQVVTETLYALAVRGDPAFIPTEIHLATTAEGAQRARLTLLSERPGWFHRLRRDFDLPPLRFDDATIHVLSHADGSALGDIRSREDNEQAADFLTEQVRALTADPLAALHVSIAGGRKTMGLYAGYALSLFGRPQDRLSHVLVSWPFESNQNFFYPTPYPEVIYTAAPENRPIDAREAQVTLAAIPFVRLRHGLPQSLLEGSARFHEAVAAAQENLGPPQLVLDLPGQRVLAGGQTLALPAADLAFLSWFARRAAADHPGLACPRDGVPEPGYAADYLREYRAIRGVMGDDERSARRYRDGMAKANFEERKSKLKRLLEQKLGRHAAAPYLVAGEGRRPMRYRLQLPAQSVRYAALAGAVHA